MWRGVLLILLALPVQAFETREEASKYLKGEIQKLYAYRTNYPEKLHGMTLDQIMSSKVRHVELHENFGLDWTDYGYFTLTDMSNGELVLSGDGSISRTLSPGATQAAANWDAYKRGNDGTKTYKVNYPKSERIEARVLRTLNPLPTDTPPRRPPVNALDTLESLGECMFFCPADNSGARGGTYEPPGDNSNDGMSPWEPKATLDQLGKPKDGMDVCLCEGGIFEDEELYIQHSGDIGPKNRKLVEIHRKALRIVQYEQHDLIRWMLNNHPDLVPHPEYPPFSKAPGFLWEEVDWVKVGGYKLPGGVSRPIMNPSVPCERGTIFKCWSEDHKRSFSSSSAYRQFLATQPQ